MKKIEKKYFCEDGSKYLWFIGSNLIGKFDLKGNACGRIIEALKDMFKVVDKNDISVIRLFKRKGVCLEFDLTNNNVRLSEPKVYSLPTIEIGELIDLWEGLL